MVFLLGTLILQIWYVLDCADGEVARYRAYQKNQILVKDKESFPITGGYWDYLNHYIVHGLVPLTVSYGLFLAYNNSAWILIGFLASLFQTLLLAVHDTKSRAFIGKIRKLSDEHWVRYRKDGKTAGPGEGEGERWGLTKWAFVIMHYTCTYPTVMNVATLCGIAAVIWRTDGWADFRALFLLYYVIASGIVFLGLAAKNLWNSGLDREFDQSYCVQNQVIHNSK